MPYREKKIYSGNMLEVEIYPITLQDRKQKRKKKEKESPLKQKNLNDKNAKKKLIRLINTNFIDKDLVLHLTYTDKELPKSEEAARRDVANYIRRVKRYREKNGLDPLKYIAVIEYKEQTENSKAIRIHHHIVISEMDRDIAEQLWTKGRANADRLKGDEFGYEALGRYITKDPKGNKRWTQSKNLKQPKVKVNDFKFTKREVIEMSKYPEDRAMYEKLYSGYILSDCKANVNEITAETYLYIKMRKLKP
ncbi:hypothetical protein [Clostridium thailandense]|uniref:rolling circle replication-associated protein n=1 Tax=Clostridium thailandense TaxID=2794346 RepID=UPI00398978B9